MKCLECDQEDCKCYPETIGSGTFEDLFRDPGVDQPREDVRLVVVQEFDCRKLALAVINELQKMLLSMCGTPYHASEVIDTPLQDLEKRHG